MNNLQYRLIEDESSSKRSVKIDKIESCPFCKSNNLETRNVGDGRCISICVCCFNCGCEGPTAIFAMEAETLWNTRI